MQQNSLLESYLRQLKLPTFAQNYAAIASDAARTGLSCERYLLAYHLNFSGKEKPIIWMKLFCSDRDGSHSEKEGTISAHVTPRQEAANCKSFARSSMRLAKLGNWFV